MIKESSVTEIVIDQAAGIFLLILVAIFFFLFYISKGANVSWILNAFWLGLFWWLYIKPVRSAKKLLNKMETTGGTKEPVTPREVEEKLRNLIASLRARPLIGIWSHKHHKLVQRLENKHYLQQYALQTIQVLNRAGEGDVFQTLYGATKMLDIWDECSDDGLPPQEVADAIKQLIVVCEEDLIDAKIIVEREVVWQKHLSGKEEGAGFDNNMKSIAFEVSQDELKEAIETRDKLETVIDQLKELSLKIKSKELKTYEKKKLLERVLDFFKEKSLLSP